MEMWLYLSWIHMLAQQSKTEDKLQVLKKISVNLFQKGTLLNLPSPN